LIRFFDGSLGFAPRFALDTGTGLPSRSSSPANIQCLIAFSTADNAVWLESFAGLRGLRFGALGCFGMELTCRMKRCEESGRGTA
jgi:hypothetical protein